MKSIRGDSAQIEQLKNELATADAILIGAGAGLSTAAGLTYSGERFVKYFSDFREKYGITDMYAGGFYPYQTPEEYWAWWSRQIYYNRYAVPAGKPYLDLLSLVQGRDYFVLTTNVDHQFQLAGFDKKRLFYTQGDYGLLQCADGCQNLTYENEEMIRQMVLQQKDGKVPTALIPHCPQCGKPLTVHLRCDDHFVQDAGWYAAASRYEDFVRRHESLHVLFLELGVGGNTPVIIKYPFWQMTAINPKAVYICVNKGEAYCPAAIRKQSVCIDSDIGEVFRQLRNAEGTTLQ